LPKDKQVSHLSIFNTTKVSFIIYQTAAGELIFANITNGLLTIGLLQIDFHSLDFIFYFHVMFKSAILLICAFVCMCSTEAQIKKKIKKGRRNKSESQFMLDENYLQAEWEIGHESITDDLSTTIYPNLAVRYGINKQLEVNAEISFVTASDQTAQQKNTTGIEPISLGFNYLLLNETKKQPAIIFSAQVAIPFLAGNNFTANYFAPAIELIIEKVVSPRIIIAASGGAFWDGFLPNPSFIYNGAASYSFTKQWMLTTEWFGFVNGGLPLHNTDINLSYALNKRVQFGITSGIGLTYAAHNSYFAINGVWGCSLRRRKLIKGF
jgi:hypothetical protein